MNFRHVQAPTAVVMVRPHRFRVNGETLADNAFQAPSDVSLSAADLAVGARAEFDGCVEALTAAGAQGISVDFTLPNLVDTLAAGPFPLPAGAIGVS